jgi:tetratricopeptide (TPR) repeat protein
LVVSGASPLKQALDVLARLLDRDSKDVGALYLQSQAYRRTGDVFAAERSARAILAVEPDSVAGAYALALVLGQSRRFKDVVDHLEPFVALAAARGQSATDLLTYLSVAYQALGRHNEAIDALKRAKSAARDGTPALDARLVQAHVGAKRYAEAVSLAEAAQKRYPDELQFAYLQARALFQGGASSQALSLLEAVVGSHPDDLESYLTLAELYGESGRLDDGLELLDRAAQQFPDNVAVPFRRGSILAEAKRDADAEEAFRGVLNRQPDNGPALNYLGYMLADRGSRLDEAIELITRALSSDKDNPSYLDSLGWALFKRGDLTEAKKHLTRAADALPLNSVVQDHYGDLLAKAGRYRDAVDAWIKALNGDSDEIDPRVVEQKIRDTRGKIR